MKLSLTIALLFWTTSNCAMATNACTGANQSELRNQLAKSDSDAWPRIATLLCAPKSARSKAYVAAHLSRTLIFDTSETGSDDESAVVAVDAELIDELLRSGIARDASLVTDGTRIKLSYYSDEACVHSRTLQRIDRKWRIVALGAACD